MFVSVVPSRLQAPGLHPQTYLGGWIEVSTDGIGRSTESKSIPVPPLPPVELLVSISLLSLPLLYPFVPPLLSPPPLSSTRIGGIRSVAFVRMVVDVAGVWEVGGGAVREDDEYDFRPEGSALIAW